MSKKLLKRNCWVLIRAINGNRKPSVSILGVFKKQKEAQAYLKWLNPKDTENYDIRPSERFVYVDVWGKELEKIPMPQISLYDYYKNKKKENRNEIKKRISR